MIQFIASPIEPGKMACTLTGCPPAAFAEVRFQNLSNGQSAVRVVETTSSGSAIVDFPGMTRDHAVHVRLLPDDHTIYRLSYPAEQPDNGGLLLSDTATVPRPTIAPTAPYPIDADELPVSYTLFTPSAEKDLI